MTTLRANLGGPRNSRRGGATHAGLAARFRQLFDSVRAIVTNTSWMVATTAVNALLGLAYWGAAARLFPPELVGTAAASVAAMVLISTVGMLGFGSLLLGGLSARVGESRAVITTALATTGLVSALLGIGTAFLASTIDPDLAFLRHDPATIAIFALGGVLLTVSLVLDQALIGLGRGGWQFWRNAAMAALKLVLLVALGLGHPWPVSWLTIYGTWTIALFVSLLGLALPALRRGGPLAAYRPRWHLLRGLGRLAGGHHIINLALMLPGQVLPLVVTAVLSSTENAYFYIAWQFAGFIFVPPVALSVSLYAAAAGAPEALTRKLRFTLGAATAIGLAANLVVFIGGGLALGLYGGDYASEATWPLRIIGIGVIPLIVKDHWVALRRIAGRLGGAIPLIVGGSLLELLLAAWGGAHGGLNGLALGWLAATTIEALVMGWPVLRAALGTGQVGPAPAPLAPTPAASPEPQGHLPWWARTETE